MKVDWKNPSDSVTLETLVSNEHNAKQRDRYRVVLLAGQGLSGQAELHREQIAATVGRSRQFVDEWVKRYRCGGIESLSPRKQPGARPKLTQTQQQQLKALLDAGPLPEEGLAAYNGPILRDKIQQHFGKLYSLAGLYALLHRIGYNDLMPRTTHPGSDQEAQETFKKRPCPSGSSR